MSDGFSVLFQVIAFQTYLKNMLVKLFTPRAATLNEAMLFFLQRDRVYCPKWCKKYAIVELLSQSRGENKTYL